MNTDYIEINTQSSIKLNLDKKIYFDPYKIENGYHDADIIFITHDHFDHMDIISIDQVKNENTIVVVPKSMKEVIDHTPFKEYFYLEPFDEINIENIHIKAVPAYNIEKNFHPKQNNWLGYLVTINNVTYYIAGDTDVTPENKNVECDVAFIPIGGHFTMDVSEAAELIKIINPKLVIPIHYGSIIGDKSDFSKLKELLSNTNIEIIEKLYFK